MDSFERRNTGAPNNGPAFYRKDRAVAGTLLGPPFIEDYRTIMKLDEIKKTVAEAKRFIKAAENLIEARKVTYTSGSYTFNASTPKESGTTRRASLDLTRQLAEMRRS